MEKIVCLFGTSEKRQRCPPSGRDGTHGFYGYEKLPPLQIASHGRHHSLFKRQNSKVIKTAKKMENSSFSLLTLHLHEDGTCQTHQ